MDLHGYSLAPQVDMAEVVDLPSNHLRPQPCAFLEEDRDASPLCDMIMVMFTSLNLLFYPFAASAYQYGKLTKLALGHQTKKHAVQTLSFLPMSLYTHLILTASDPTDNFSGIVVNIEHLTYENNHLCCSIHLYS